ncbi:hypothetical protein [Streptomyces sp. TLI_146]|uniref:hypothetical protein n=1 Tax=Streptomyces sp. TLI_146 TaxID=1938858 RepID=UPI00117DF6E2|nr:hypothetical protein [Streptomyces sp. TLI_146]
MSARETLLKQAADIDGVCVLTSSAATEVAYSMADEELSAFTGALRHLLRTGVPDAGAPWWHFPRKSPHARTCAFRSRSVLSP